MEKREKGKVKESWYEANRCAWIVPGTKLQCRLLGSMSTNSKEFYCPIHYDALDSPSILKSKACAIEWCEDRKQMGFDIMTDPNEVWDLIHGGK